jgi:23S rRNA (uracil1939-C5)-methyltransferase
LRLHIHLWQPMTETTLRIQALGRRGEGVAQLGDRRILVAGALPGEEVVVEDADNHPQVKAVLHSSPERIDPACGYFGRCGGCQLQHWRADAYRAWKAAQVTEALVARGVTGTIDDCIDAHGAGRRRVSLHVRRSGGRVSAGFMAARSHSLLDITSCPVLETTLVRAFDIARDLGTVLGDCDVALTATLTGLDVSIKVERARLPPDESVLISLLHEHGLARLTVNGETLATAIAPRVRFGRAEVTLPPGGFLQATMKGEEVLAGLVLDMTGKARAVADLFCGVGPFSFRLAERARVDAYDNDEAAISALVEAGRRTTGLKPVSGHVRDLFREPLVPNEMKDFDVVVFDPPRAGAEAQARQLARSTVRTVVAISCDAVTFARDAGILISGGYALTRLVAVDQFKWSSHVEIAALFKR